MYTAELRALCVALWLVAGLVSAPAVRADQADDQFAVAAGNYDRRQWKLAVAEFETFLKLYPQDRRAAQSAFFLGEAQLQLGKFDDARKSFQDYLAREPQGNYARSALFRLGEAAYLGGHYAAAKPDLETFLAKYPDDRLSAYVLPYLGEIALSGGELANAAERFRTALARFPDGPLQEECLFGLARTVEKRGEADEAERLYKTVAGKPKGRLIDAAQFHLGAVQYMAGRYADALASFAAFDGRAADNPWQPNAHLGRGLSLLKLDRPAEALPQFDAVLAAPSAGNELSQQALRGKIQASLLSKDYAGVDSQTAEFNKRFAGSPLADDVRRMSARSLVERKQYEAAVSVLEPLVKTSRAASQTFASPDDLDSHYMLAVSYEALKRYQEAIETLAPVIKSAEGQLKSDAQLTHGSLLVAMKKYNEAIAPLEAVVAAKPSGEAAVKACGELAICYARTGQLDKAKKVYAELVANHAEHPLLAPTAELLAEAAYDANDAAWSAELSKRLATGGSSQFALKGKLGLAWSQFKDGKLDQSAATFEEVLKGNPPQAMAAEAAYARGWVLEQLGQQQPALAMYQVLVEQPVSTRQRGEAMLAAARLCEKLKQPRQAADLYERLEKEYLQFEQLDAVLYELAWVMRELKRPEDGDKLFERLRKEYPQSKLWAVATCPLAQRALDAKDFDRATKLSEEVLSRKSTADSGGKVAAEVREYAAMLRGQAAVAKADWPKVREAYKLFSDEFPSSPRRNVAEFWIAEALYRQGDYTAAGQRLEKLAAEIEGEHEPWMAMILLRRAQVLAQQAQVLEQQDLWSDAQSVAETIAKDFPDFEQQYEADYLLGRCLASQAEYSAAREAYERVIRSKAGEKTETAAMAQWMIGESYFHQKDYEAALKAYTRLEILYAYPKWQAGAKLQAGKCHEHLGEKDEAVLCYKTILEKYSDTPFAKQAEQRLKSIENAR